MNPFHSIWLRNLLKNRMLNLNCVLSQNWWMCWKKSWWKRRHHFWVGLVTSVSLLSIIQTTFRFAICSNHLLWIASEFRHLKMLLLFFCQLDSSKFEELHRKRWSVSLFQSRCWTFCSSRFVIIYWISSSGLWKSFENPWESWTS